MKNLINTLFLSLKLSVLHIAYALMLIGYHTSSPRPIFLFQCILVVYFLEPFTLLGICKAFLIRVRARFISFLRLEENVSNLWQNPTLLLLYRIYSRLNQKRYKPGNRLKVNNLLVGTHEAFCTGGLLR